MTETTTVRPAAWSARPVESRGGPLARCPEGRDDEACRRQAGPSLTEIDHVAIAVLDLDAAIAWYESALGAELAHRETVEHDGVEEALLAVAESFIQLLTPISDSSPVARFLERKGEGLHHVGYRVRRLRRGPRAHAGRRCRADRREPEAGLARDDGRLRAPPQRLRHPHRAGPGVAARSLARKRGQAVRGRAQSSPRKPR